jgi:lipoprotein-releasing system permease protein
VENQGYLVGRGSAGALVRGVLPSMEPRVSDFNTHMKAGHFDALTPGSWNILIGDELAAQLGVGMGDKVTVYAPQFRATPMGGVPRLRRFTVAGIFSMGMQDYDSGLVLMNMHDAEKLYSMRGPTGIRLRLTDMFDAYPVSRQLSNTLGSDYRVRTWMQTHANLFKALSMEKMVMFLILSLIIGVATFNLVSTLVMLVTDKQADIAILRTLGATPRTIMGVFMIQGMTVGLFGIALGVIFGVLLSLNVPAIVDWIQNVFHVQFLSPDVYYISEVPSRLDWHDVGWVAVMAFVLCLLATIYPAWRASRTQPAQALRYE